MVYYYIIAGLVIAIDQFTKWLVVHNMEIYEQIPIINDFFYLTSHRNPGAAWGILQNQMIFFYIVTVIVLAGVVYYLHTYARGNRKLSIGLDRKSTRLNSSHVAISYAVFCLKK